MDRSVLELMRRDDVDIESIGRTGFLLFSAWPAVIKQMPSAQITPR